MQLKMEVNKEKFVNNLILKHLYFVFVNSLKIGSIHKKTFWKDLTNFDLKENKWKYGNKHIVQLLLVITNIHLFKKKKCILAEKLKC